MARGRERDVARRRRTALADDLLDLAAHGLEGDAERLERLGGDALALVDEAEEDVLGADVVVVEEARFLLRQHHDPAGPVGEAFEQLDRLYGWTDTWAECTGGLGPPRSSDVARAARRAVAERVPRQPGWTPRVALRDASIDWRSVAVVPAASPLLALAAMDADLARSRSRAARVGADHRRRT